MARASAERRVRSQAWLRPKVRVRLALAFALLVLGGLSWFWLEQIQAVLETLALAYG